VFASSVHRFVLWDIDKTLVDIGGISRELYAEAFEKVTGQPLSGMPGMAGKTDRDLTLTALRRQGISEPEGLLERFYEALTQATAARQAAIRQQGRRLPGALAAVASLDRPGVVQTVVTGNIRPIAEIKLRTFGLAGYIDFDIGGYGSDDGERATLVRRARERAAGKYGALEARRVVIIGDTTYDIAGAKANGVRAVGVASGEISMNELAAAGADGVLPSLEDTDRLTRLVFGDAD
jgi:phosphoglycolate phosphatase